MGLIGDKSALEAIELLITGLHNEEKYIKSHSAEALEKIGDECAVGPLIAALEDDGWEVSRYATSALAEIGESAVQPLIAALEVENWRVRRSAAEALGQIGEPAVEPLIAALQNENSHVRDSASEALAHIGGPAVEPLIAALKNEDLNVYTGAGQALAQIGEPAAVSLIDTLWNESEDVRWIAADILERIDVELDQKQTKRVAWILKDTRSEPSSMFTRLARLQAARLPLFNPSRPKQQVPSWIYTALGGAGAVLAGALGGLAQDAIKGVLSSWVGTVSDAIYWVIVIAIILLLAGGAVAGYFLQQRTDPTD